MSNGRAPKGGTTGVNGEQYAGGQFLPSSKKTIKGEMGSSRKRAPKPCKIQIAPYEWAECPEEGVHAIYTRISDYARVNWETCKMEANINLATLEFYNETEEEILALIDRWNSGERWV